MVSRAAAACLLCWSAEVQSYNCTRDSLTLSVCRGTVILGFEQCNKYTVMNEKGKACLVSCSWEKNPRKLLNNVCKRAGDQL